MSFVYSTLEQPIYPKHPFVVSISASRGSGKSTLIRDLLKNVYYKTFDYIVILSPSLDVNHDYTDINNDYVKHPVKKEKEYIIKLSDVSRFKEAIQEILTSQRDIIKEKGKKNTPKVLIIADDVIDSGILRDKFLDTVSHRGRHLEVSLFISTQKITSLSPIIRNNSDFFIVFKSNNYQELERFLIEFIPRKYKHSFEEELLKVFQIPYVFICINNQTKTLKDRIMIGFHTTLNFQL